MAFGVDGLCLTRAQIDAILGDFDAAVRRYGDKPEPSERTIEELALMREALAENLTELATDDDRDAVRGGTTPCAVGHSDGSHLADVPEQAELEQLRREVRELEGRVQKARRETPARLEPVLSKAMSEILEDLSPTASPAPPREAVDEAPTAADQLVETWSKFADAEERADQLSSALPQILAEAKAANSVLRHQLAERSA